MLHTCACICVQLYLCTGTQEIEWLKDKIPDHTALQMKE